MVCVHELDILYFNEIQHRKVVESYWENNHDNHNETLDGQVLDMLTNLV